MSSSSVEDIPECKDLFTQDGVLLKACIGRPVTDLNSIGMLCIVQNGDNTKCIEWRPNDLITIDSDTQDQEWAVVNTIVYYGNEGVNGKRDVSEEVADLLTKSMSALEDATTVTKNDEYEYLLDYYPWHMTHSELRALHKKKTEEYFSMKLQWKSMTEGQEARFSEYRDRKSLVEKDVNRTDRTHPFFAGDDNPNLVHQLLQLQQLLSFASPQLARHLAAKDSGNMYFCFRLWEVLWTGLPCSNFHLLICVAILDAEKDSLISRDCGFTEILKHVNDLSMCLDVDRILSSAEGIYHQVVSAPDLNDQIRVILGLPPVGATSSTQGNDDEEETPQDNGTGETSEGSAYGKDMEEDTLEYDGIQLYIVSKTVWALLA
ncbi:unnamed protein product [Chilo suppressalis]|uniref:Uncharacterized protein n=1 Tax=Chilo suppressalis TaxID=168631 RepID=A0ABN8BAG6_CHISP|nr:unnamed protein product [Chilo suppressalis]